MLSFLTVGPFYFMVDLPSYVLPLHVQLFRKSKFILLSMKYFTNTYSVKKHQNRKKSESHINFTSILNIPCSLL